MFDNNIADKPSYLFSPHSIVPGSGLHVCKLTYFKAGRGPHQDSVLEQEEFGCTDHISYKIMKAAGDDSFDLQAECYTHYHDYLFYR